MKRILILAGLCSAYISSVYGASFECSSATNKVEKLICSDASVSLLDDELDARYTQLTDEPYEFQKHKLAQRKWLRDVRNNCSDINCLKNAYLNRLYELSWDADYVKNAPKMPVVKVLCEKLASEAERRLILLSQQGVEDINNDGHAETSNDCWGGTMNTPCTDYFDQKGNPISVEQAGFEWKDYWTYGSHVFRFNGRTYFLNTYDDGMQEPAYLSYITPANKEYVLCEFDNKKETVIGFEATAPSGVCLAALTNEIEFGVLIEEKKFPYPFLGRAESSAQDVEQMDVNNDGTPELVTEVTFSSGGGRGCDFNYFEILDASRADVSNGELRTIFLKMQGIDDARYWWRSCGHIENRLFIYKENTYYERNVTSARSSERAIYQQRGLSIETVCRYKTEISTRIKRVMGDPKEGLHSDME